MRHINRTRIVLFVVCLVWLTPKRNAGGLVTHSHDHNHDDHAHSHESGIWGKISHLFHFHGYHDQSQAANDPAMATTQGIRTVWLALFGLVLTTGVQAIVVAISHSTALLADMVHNLGDTVNSIPLLIAFYLARRVATTRYTYGYGKAEDIAGIFVVASLVFSAGYTLYEAISRFLHPEPFSNLGWVAVAAVVGFVGNETIALMQIRVGRQIGSATMVADGLHTRTDGFASLAVLVAVGGAWLGYPIVDPLIGLVIGITIAVIGVDACKMIWYRLMDAVDPTIVTHVHTLVAAVAQVQQVGAVRVRWHGHKLLCELEVTISPTLTIAQGDAIRTAIIATVQQHHPQMASVAVVLIPGFA